MFKSHWDVGLEFCLAELVSLPCTSFIFEFNSPHLFPARHNKIYPDIFLASCILPWICSSSSNRGGDQSAPKYYITYTVEPESQHPSTQLMSHTIKQAELRAESWGKKKEESRDLKPLGESCHMCSLDLAMWWILRRGMSIAPAQCGTTIPGTIPICLGHTLSTS